MKKVILATVMALVSAVSIFAQSKAPTEKNKIGGYLGWPIGFSYSHKMSPLMELDIMAGADTVIVNDRYYDIGNHVRYAQAGEGFGFDGRVGVLFRCWEGHLWPGAYGKVSVGPAAGIFLGAVPFYDYNYGTTKDYFAFGFNVSGPVRFDIDFNFPLNVFVEVVPAGLQVSFTEVGGHSLNGIYYYGRGAIGARYRF